MHKQHLRSFHIQTTTTLLTAIVNHTHKSQTNKLKDFPFVVYLETQLIYQSCLYFPNRFVKKKESDKSITIDY